MCQRPQALIEQILKQCPTIRRWLDLTTDPWSTKLSRTSNTVRLCVCACVCVCVCVVTWDRCSGRAERCIYLYVFLFFFKSSRVISPLYDISQTPLIFITGLAHWAFNNELPIYFSQISFQFTLSTKWSPTPVLPPPTPPLRSMFNKVLTLHWVPADSSSRGGDVTVYVYDITNQACPLLFLKILFLCLFLSLGPFQLYFIP